MKNNRYTLIIRRLKLIDCGGFLRGTYLRFLISSSFLYPTLAPGKVELLPEKHRSGKATSKSRDR